MSVNRIVLIAINLAVMLIVSNALKCYHCGEYNEGVGSITPCLNYTEQSAHLFLKDCPRSIDKYCIVSKHLLFVNSILQKYLLFC